MLVMTSGESGTYVGNKTITGTLAVGTSLTLAGASSGTATIVASAVADTVTVNKPWIMTGGGQFNANMLARAALTIGLGSTGTLGWADNVDAAIGTVDTKLVRDAANTLAQRNGATAQEKRIYETFTDASNYSRLAIIATAGGPHDLVSQAAGTGTVRNLRLNPGTADLQWGKALVALGGGAAPTVGTIGGSGPATAAQNSWLRVLDSTGAACFIPVWK